jgi:glutamate transport system substrate-binding protein
MAGHSRALLNLVLVCLAVAACTPTSADGGPAGSGIKIGIKFDQPGLGLKQGSRYTGLDVDVATYVAEQLGHKASDIRWVQAPSSQRETLISTGQVDLVVATYSITDARQQKVSFAGPYFVAGQDLMVRSDDTSITGPESLTGKKICSVSGSTSAQKIKDSYPGVQLQEVNTYSQCVEALLAKMVDAVTTDDVILAGYAAQDRYRGRLRVVGKPFTQERYGIGFRLGDMTLCDSVTRAIALMISTGEWQRAVTANLGPSGYRVNQALNPPKQDVCTPPSTTTTQP